LFSVLKKDGDFTEGKPQAVAGIKHFFHYGGASRDHFLEGERF
jgi:hypothetical protein